MKSDTKPLLARLTVISILVIIHLPTSNHDHIVNQEAYFAPLNEERPLTFSSLYRILIVPYRQEALLCLDLRLHTRILTHSESPLMRSYPSSYSPW